MEISQHKLLNILMKNFVYILSILYTYIYLDFDKYNVN